MRKKNTVKFLNLPIEVIDVKDHFSGYRGFHTANSFNYGYQGNTFFEPTNRLEWLRKQRGHKVAESS